MRPPAFQFYAADYLASQRVQMLSLEEEGAYIRLLAFCWLHGSIPADPEQVARLIGKGASTTLATTVLTMFQPSAEQGRMVHDRLEVERAKQAAWREKSTQGGRESARKRKGGSRVVQGSLKGGSRVVQPEGNTTVYSLQSTSKRESKGPAFPQLGEVVEYGRTVMASPECSESFWNAKEADGWTDRNGRTLVDWRPLFRNWVTRWKSNESRQKPNGARNHLGQKPGEIPTDVSIHKVKRL